MSVVRYSPPPNNPAMTDSREEHRLLREFYEAWCFLHEVRNEPAASEAWQESRLRLSAQGLTNAAAAVAAHLKSH
jgi:hypothetical protein